MPRVPKPDFVKTMTKLQWDNAPFEERVLHVARSQEVLKVKEVSANWGPQVKIYLYIAGYKNPAPWCAAFLYWCCITAGADPKKLPRPGKAGSTYFLWEWAKDTGRLKKTPKRGRAFIWNGAGGGHTGFVTDGKAENQGYNEAFTTIEGNSNTTGSREGIQVVELHKRTINVLDNFPRWGFIDLSDLD